MKLLFLGDIFGRAGRRVIRELLPELKKEYHPDVVVANAENISHGVGLRDSLLEEMKQAGVDYFTSGNHAFKLEDQQVWMREDLVRPLNLLKDSQTSGKGAILIKAAGEQVWLANLQGLIFMSEYLKSPFAVFEKFLKEHKSESVVVDFHAEATSEKVAFGLKFDGRVAAVWGTHTHVQTADERILPQGTGYITDVGMCGALDGVIGVKSEKALSHFETGLPLRVEPAGYPGQLNGILLDLDTRSNKTRTIKRIYRIATD